MQKWNAQVLSWLDRTAMSQDTSAQAISAQSFPVSVIVAQEPVVNLPWTTERWTVLGIIAGEQMAQTHGQQNGHGDDANGNHRLIRSGSEGKQYLWPGFALRLLRSEADSYYVNLVGKTPSVYVVGQRDDAGALLPILTTVEYLEATGYAEADYEVFAVPMPPEIYRWVEAFVLEHYTPDEKKMKRKHHPDEPG